MLASKAQRLRLKPNRSQQSTIQKHETPFESISAFISHYWKYVKSTPVYVKFALMVCCATYCASTVENYLLSPRIHRFSSKASKDGGANVSSHVTHGLSHSLMIESLIVRPGLLLPPHFQFWSLLTSPFVETHILSLCVSVFTLTLASHTLLLSSSIRSPHQSSTSVNLSSNGTLRRTNRSWTHLNLMLFFFVVNITSSLMCCTWVYLSHPWSKHSNVKLYEPHINGMFAFSASVLIALKQSFSDHVLTNIICLKFTVGHLPQLALFIFISIYFMNLSMISQMQCALFFSGFVIGWTYLRFFQKHKNTSILSTSSSLPSSKLSQRYRKGDLSSDFAFENLFYPKPVRFLIGLISNAIFNVLVKLRFCDPISVASNKNDDEVNLSNLSSKSVSISLPGHDDQNTVTVNLATKSPSTVFSTDVENSVTSTANLVTKCASTVLSNDGESSRARREIRLQMLRDKLNEVSSDEVTKEDEDSISSNSNEDVATIEMQNEVVTEKPDQTSEIADTNKVESCSYEKKELQDEYVDDQTVPK